MDVRVERLRRVTETVIGSAIEVHRALGPGLLESAYEICLAHELNQRGVAFTRQQILPVNYKGVVLDAAYRMDFVVEGVVLVELKAVAELLPVHDAQVLTYLRLSRIDVGLLLNFHSPALRRGIKRFAREGAALPYAPHANATRTNR